MGIRVELGNLQLLGRGGIGYAIRVWKVMGIRVELGNLHYCGLVLMCHDMLCVCVCVETRTFDILNLTLSVDRVLTLTVT